MFIPDKLEGNCAKLWENWKNWGEKRATRSTSFQSSRCFGAVLAHWPLEGGGRGRCETTRHSRAPTRTHVMNMQKEGTSPTRKPALLEPPWLSFGLDEHLFFGHWQFFPLLSFSPFSLSLAHLCAVSFGKEEGGCFVGTECNPKQTHEEAALQCLCSRLLTVEASGTASWLGGKKTWKLLWLVVVLVGFETRSDCVGARLKIRYRRENFLRKDLAPVSQKTYFLGLPPPVLLLSPFQTVAGTPQGCTCVCVGQQPSVFGGVRVWFGRYCSLGPNSLTFIIHFSAPWFARNLSTTHLLRDYS